MARTFSCSCSTLSMKCKWSARRKMNIRFADGVRSNSSYIPASGSEVSFSAAKYSVGTSRPQEKVSFAGIIPGFGCELPPGASATTAQMRSSISSAASAVQPPKLCPTIPIRVGSRRISESHGAPSSSARAESVYRARGSQSRLPLAQLFAPRSRPLDEPVPAPPLRSDPAPRQRNHGCSIGCRETSTAAGASAAMRKDDERISPRLSRGGIPDLNREQAVPRSIEHLEGTHAEGPWAGGEWIVLAGHSTRSGYSLLSAACGSMRAALQAGTNPARRATAIKRAAEASQTAGSLGCTP